MGYTYGTEICKRLGAGAFGVVYKMDNPRGAPYSRKHKIVAVKKIAVSVNLFIAFVVSIDFKCHLSTLRTPYQNLVMKLTSSRHSITPGLSSTSTPLPTFVAISAL